MSDQTFPGFDDAKSPPLPEPEAGSASAELNRLAHEAFANAHNTGTDRETAPPPSP